jgi:hypothetical protein
MTQAFNLSQLANKVNTSGELDASTGLYNQAPVANGGTGKSTVTSGALLLGAGTSAMTELTGTTPGTVVAASPAGWVATPAPSIAGGNYIMQDYTSPNVWTKPGSVKAIKVTVVGAGGVGGNATNSGPTSMGLGGSGGGGGAAIIYLDAPAIPGSPISITAGAGTNSFGSLASATAGSAGAASGAVPNSTHFFAGGAGGVGSVSPTIPAPASIVINGNGGGSTISFSTGVKGVNPGGSSIFGGGAVGATGTPGVTTNGNAGGNFGGGGSGAMRNVGPAGTNTGGAGGPGIVIVEEFY